MTGPSATVVLGRIDALTRERDRARDLAAALEAQLAAVQAICDTASPMGPNYSKIRAVLNPEQP